MKNESDTATQHGHKDLSSTPRFTKVVFAVVLLLATGAFAVVQVSLPKYLHMSRSIARLSSEVAELRREQTMPSDFFNRYRDSICYTYASYVLKRPSQLTTGPSEVELRISGTGFVIGKGLLATNRHVIEAEFTGKNARRFLAMGAKPELKEFVAYFPGMRKPTPLKDIRWSDDADVAIASFVLPHGRGYPTPLPLAASAPRPGDGVVVIGYPMGVPGMVAKSPESVYRRLAWKDETISVANDLAVQSLIRPSATFGHVGDVVGQKLIYDAPTAHGGSGGPVLNSKGEVVAINTGYVQGFAGGTLGLSVDLLKPLLRISAGTASFAH